MGLTSYMKNISNNKQSGAVSLFVVIFAMLIITVITVSFLRLMMADQRQASDNDLSQSAYDSAQAGVEDAKRALLRYQEICASSASECATLSAQLVTPECNAAVRIGDVVNPSDESGGNASQTGEIKVQQTESSTSDQALNQAYTCVTIQLETPDYIGSVTAGQSQLVPLVGANTFDTVTINWYSREDVTSADGKTVLSSSNDHIFTPTSTWNTNTPSVMRAQLIQFGSSFTLSDFDMVNASGESNMNTVFLYPTSGATTTSAPFAGLDIRKTSPTDDPDPDQPTDTPRAVKCQSSVSAGGYACSMSLTLPTPINGGNRTAFLRLTPFYNATHYQVVLSNGASTVNFKDVQPSIDSTGRANDVFRRVQSRVNLYNTDFPYPDGTIDVTNNFCKNFGVSDTPDTYTATNTCTP